MPIFVLVNSLDWAAIENSIYRFVQFLLILGSLFVPVLANRMNEPPEMDMAPLVITSIAEFALSLATVTLSFYRRYRMDKWEEDDSARWLLYAVAVGLMSALLWPLMVLINSLTVLGMGVFNIFRGLSLQSK